MNSSRGLHPNQVISADEEQCRSEIRRWQKASRNSWRVLHGAPLSVFIEPSRVDSRLKSTVFSEVLPLILVSGSYQSSIEAAFLDAGMPGVKLIKEVLDGESVPCFVGQIGDRSRVREFLDRIDSSQSHLRHATSPVTNRPERWLLTEACVSLRLYWPSKVRRLFKDHPDALALIDETVVEQETKWRTYPEMSLGRIVGGGDPAASADRNKFPVDLLIATTPPESLPQLVIEFDGATHREEDRFRKDEIRDSILIEAGVPVLRFSSQNPGVSKKHWEAEQYVRPIRPAHEPSGTFLGFLVAHLMDHAERVRVSRARASASAKKAARDFEIWLKAKSTREKRIFSESERFRLLEQFMEATANTLEHDEWRTDDAVDRAEAAIEYRQLIDGEWLLGAGHRGFQLSNIKTEAVQGNGVKASGLLRRGAERQVIETGTFFATLKLPESHRFACIDLDCIRDDAARFTLLVQALDLAPGKNGENKR